MANMSLDGFGMEEQEDQFRMTHIQKNHLRRDISVIIGPVRLLRSGAAFRCSPPTPPCSIMTCQGFRRKDACQQTMLLRFVATSRALPLLSIKNRGRSRTKFQLLWLHRILMQVCLQVTVFIPLAKMNLQPRMILCKRRKESHSYLKRALVIVSGQGSIVRRVRRTRLEDSARGTRRRRTRHRFAKMLAANTACLLHAFRHLYARETMLGILVEYRKIDLESIASATTASDWRFFRRHIHPIKIWRKLDLLSWWALRNRSLSLHCEWNTSYVISLNTLYVISPNWPPSVLCRSPKWWNPRRYRLLRPEISLEGDPTFICTINVKEIHKTSQNPNVK